MKARVLFAIGMLTAVALLALGCNNDQEEWEGVVFLEIEWTGTNCFDWALIGPAPTIREQSIQWKSKKPVSDTTFLDVQLEDLWVTWRRIDGGTRVPRPYHAVFDLLVPAGGTANLNNGPLMEPEQLNETPFDVLFPENGGTDSETGSTVIRLEATLTYYGKTFNGDKVAGELKVNEDFRYASGCTND